MVLQARFLHILCLMNLAGLKVFGNRLNIRQQGSFIHYKKETDNHKGASYKTKIIKFVGTGSVPVHRGFQGIKPKDDILPVGAGNGNLR